MFDLSVNKDQYIIFSSKKPRDFVRDFLIANTIGFQDIVGSIKGELEDSFIINLNDLKLIHDGGILDGQETILLLDQEDAGRRPAYKLYTHLIHDFTLGADVLVSIGTMREVEEEVAKASDYFSYRPDLNTYFVAA